MFKHLFLILVFVFGGMGFFDFWAMMAKWCGSKDRGSKKFKGDESLPNRQNENLSSCCLSSIPVSDIPFPSRKHHSRWMFIIRPFIVQSFSGLASSRLCPTLPWLLTARMVAPSKT